MRIFLIAVIVADDVEKTWICIADLYRIRPG